MKTIQNNAKTTPSSWMMNAPKSISKFAMLGLLFLLISMSSFAGNSKNEQTAREKETSEIRKQLYSQIQFPKFMKENNLETERVSVFFQVEKSGNIKVVKSDSKNETLNKYILTEMEKAKLTTNNVNEENVYKIEIYFKLL